MLEAIARTILNKNKQYIKAIIVNPTKKVFMVKVYPENKRFKHEGNTYLVDEKALYFFNKEPVMFYTYGKSSPIVFSDESGIRFGLDASEITSILESKAVSDLLTATTKDEKDILFYMVAGCLCGIVLIFLSLTGVITLG